MVRWALLVMASVALPALVSAQTSRSSPFAPPEESDTEFIVDVSKGLDTGCQFRESGPLEFEVEITRWVGPVDGSGRLINAPALIAAGVLYSDARLVLPAFDVDVAGAEGRVPEVDRVFVNDEEVGTLTGTTDIWKVNEFRMPVQALRFPDRAALGSSPTPARNRIRIEIDTATAEGGNWCTAIDWAAVNFQAVSPVLLVHGNKSSGDFWDRHGFSEELRQAQIPIDGCGGIGCENPINLPTAAIAVNALQLAADIPDIVKSFGADSYHIVAHSKGGLDAREFLAYHQPDDIDILSLTTLSTPHDGTLLVDLLEAKNNYSALALAGFPEGTGLLSSVILLDAGKRDLSTSAAAGFNERNLARLPSADYNLVGGDADRNASGTLDQESEIAALRLDKLTMRVPGLSDAAIRIMYRILRNTSRLELRPTTRELFGGVPVSVLEVTAVPTRVPIGNDTQVTAPSALGLGSMHVRATSALIFSGNEGRNHSSIADAGVADAVIPWLLSAERSRGDLRP